MDIEQRLEAAKEKLQESQNQVQAISIATAKIKKTLVAVRCAERLAKVFECSQKERALIRTTLMDCTPPQKAQSIKNTLADYGTLENDLQEARTIFENRFAIFLENFIEDFSCADNNVLTELHSCNQESWDKFDASLKASDQKLYKKLRQKVFRLQDIPKLSDINIQILLQSIERNDLLKVLKYSGEDVKEKIFKNMSRGMVRNLKEDIEYRNVTQKDAAAAESKILTKLFQLIASSKMIMEDEV